MNLNNNEYQTLFDDEIIQRGEEYYEEGLVEKVYKVENTFHGSVMGNYLYNVEIEIEEEAIKSMSCDCPYHGNCKHEYAVLRAIENDEYREVKLLPQIERSTINFTKVLEKIPAEQLKKYLIQNKEGLDDLISFRKAFLHYLPTESKTYYYNTIVNEFLISEFDEIRDLDFFNEEFKSVDEFFQEAEEYLEAKEYKQSILITETILTAIKSDKHTLNLGRHIKKELYNEFITLLRANYRASEAKIKKEITAWLDQLKQLKYYNDYLLEDIVEQNYNFFHNNK